jgi:transcriptional/translational regulatory protein YebC/TACO1
VKAVFIAKGIKPAHAEVAMTADLMVNVDIEDGKRVLKMIDMLEDLDDVQNVYTNADIPEAAYE